MTEIGQDHAFVRETGLREGPTAAELLAFFLCQFVAGGHWRTSVAAKKYLPLCLEHLGQNVSDVFSHLPEVLLQW